MPSPASSPDTNGPSAVEVFEILVREHSSMLTAFLRSLLRRDHAVDDVFQETMLVAWRRLPDYDRSRPFGPWLRGIAANLVREHHRKNARATLIDDHEVLEALDHRFRRAAARHPDGATETLGALRVCMDTLPAPMREVLELAYGRGLNLIEVARSVGAQHETIKKRIQRARRLVVDCLLEREAAT